MADNELDKIIEYASALILLHPNLRSEYFKNPDRVLARVLPRPGLLNHIWPGVRYRNRLIRLRLGSDIELRASMDSRLVSAREAYFEKNAMVDEALHNTQRTFDAIVWLSISAFVIGAALVVGAFVAAVAGDGTTEKAVLGGLFGGGGASTTLLTVLMISRDSIRRASGDNAQMRLILTSYATEITHYRAIPIKDVQDAYKRNSRIREAMAVAVAKIEEFAEPPEPKDKKRTQKEGASAETPQPSSEASQP